MKKVFLMIMVGVLTTLSVMAQPTLVKDIITGSTGLNPELSTTLNGYLLFSSYASGYQNIYRSDGTTSGTSSFTPVDYEYYGKVYGPYNNSCYYAYQEDLYKIDNSFGRTRLKAFSTGNGWGPRDFAYAGSNVFFITQLKWKNTGSTDNQLWKTNGTATGTVLVKDLNPNNADFLNGKLTAFGNYVMFWSYDATNGSELWKSDGTSSGTTLVKDINPGTGSSYLAWTNTSTEYNMRLMFHGESYKLVYNNKFYFTATDGTYGTEIWEWDGTNDPRRRTNINTNGDSHPFNFCVLDGYLFFTAKDNNNDFELYKLDLTNANSTPSLVKNINSATTGSVKERSSFPIWLTNFNGKIYFSAYDQTNGRELWETDGTEAGTVTVKDINSGSGSSTPNDTSEYKNETRGFFIFNNKMYFMADDGTNGVELWQSDGTANGTSMVADINSGTGSSFPADFKALGSSIYFAATTGTYGRELWQFTPSSGKLSFGINEWNDGTNSKLSLYPNPAQDYLVVSADMTDAGQLSISNVLGEELVSLNLNKSNILSQKIDISTLPEGVYIVNLRIGNELIRNKFVKK